MTDAGLACMFVMLERVFPIRKGDDGMAARQRTAQEIPALVLFYDREEADSLRAKSLLEESHLFFEPVDISRGRASFAAPVLLLPTGRTLRTLREIEFFVHHTPEDIRQLATT